MANNFIDLNFADGTYRFALGLAQIDEIQRKTGVGIGRIYARCLSGVTRVNDDIVLSPSHAEFYAHDLKHVIVQGLIGGNSGEVDKKEIKVDDRLANRLFENYLANKPIADWWELAISVLSACIVGFTPPETGKKDAVATGETQDTNAPPDGST